MLIIRLQRSGKRNAPEYRIVLAEKSEPVKKDVQEVLGNYNPRTKAFSVKTERVTELLGQRVTLSPTIHNLFVTQKLLASSKVRAFSVPKKPAEPAAPAEAPKAEESAPAAPAEAPAEAVAEAPAETGAPAAEAPTETPAA